MQSANRGKVNSLQIQRKKKKKNNRAINFFTH